MFSKRRQKFPAPEKQPSEFSLWLDREEARNAAHDKSVREANTTYFGKTDDEIHDMKARKKEAEFQEISRRQDDERRKTIEKIRVSLGENPPRKRNTAGGPLL